MKDEAVIDLLLEIADPITASEATRAYKNKDHHDTLCDIGLCPVHDEYERVQFIHCEDAD